MENENLIQILITGLLYFPEHLLGGDLIKYRLPNYMSNMFTFGHFSSNRCIYGTFYSEKQQKKTQVHIE